jgi:protein-S-isoprenylcysteine O-methyltransferase Ste14
MDLGLVTCADLHPGVSAEERCTISSRRRNRPTVGFVLPGELVGGGSWTEDAVVVLPALGQRGGGWVAAQVVLIVAILLSALVGLTWPEWLAPAVYAVGSALLAVGIGLLAAGASSLGSALTPFPAPRAGQRLRTGGIYARARHPMYGGGVLLALGWSAIFATALGLLCTLLLAALFELKSRREEQWLERTYPDYAAYRATVRHRFIPYLW